MVNHVRTLLLNSGSPGSIIWPGEEYVPPLYQPVTIPDAARQIYNAIFPPGCDRAFANLRLSQLLPLLHRPQFDPIVRSFDPRITYIPFSRAAFDALLGQVNITSSSSSNALTVVRVNNVVDPTRLLDVWQIAVVNSTTLQVNGYRGDGQPIPNNVVSFTVTGGIANPVTLPGTNFAVQFAPVVGSSWQLTTLGPIESLSNAMAEVDQANTEALFASTDSTTQLLHNIWLTSPHLTDRFSAAVIAAAAVIGAQL